MNTKLKNLYSECQRLRAQAQQLQYECWHLGQESQHNYANSRRTQLQASQLSKEWLSLYAEIWEACRQQQLNLEKRDRVLAAYQSLFLP